MASDSEVTSHNDPNFAVICSFLKVFGENCGLDIINTAELQKSLENTHEISSRLKELHLKLLRRALKNVHSERWEKALIKFCHQQAYHQDAWELERFGYKKASVTVKLKILKNLLAYQFLCHTKFKNDINKLESKCLRLEPMGKDCKGRLYWIHIDKRANLRLYREDQDEETWTLIASDKESFMEVLNILRNGDQNDANISGAINEDSNSIEDSPSGLKKYSKETTNSTSPENSDNSNIESENQENKNKQKTENENENKLDANLNYSKENKKEHIKLKIKSIVNDQNNDHSEKINSLEDTKLLKSDILPKKRLKVAADSKSSEVSSSSTFSDEIEENVMIFKGEGNGAECEASHFYVGEEISDPVLFFWGEGMGNECLTGNPNLESSDENGKKDSNNPIRDEKNGVTENQQPDDVAGLQSVDESSKGPMNKQDNGMIQKGCESNIETTNIIAENDALNSKAATASLNVTRRILLNIPKSDATDNNGGETSSVKAKLWSVDAMCNDTIPLKVESIDNENHEVKLDFTVNSVLHSSDNSININTDIMHSQNEDENIISKDHKPKDEEINPTPFKDLSEKRKTDNESPSLIDTTSTTTKPKLNSLTNNINIENLDPIIVTELDVNDSEKGLPEANSFVDKLPNLEAKSETDNSSFNNVKEMKTFDDNSSVNTIGNFEDKTSITTNTNESICEKSESENKVTSKNNANNKLLSNVPVEINKKLGVLSKKPKLDVNTEIIINLKKRNPKKNALDRSNENEKTNIKETKTDLNITNTNLIEASNDILINNSTKKHLNTSKHLNKSEELENNIKIEKPKDKIKLKSSKVPQKFQEDIKKKKVCDVDSNSLNLNPRSKLRNKQVKPSNLEPKEDIVKSNQIEIYHPVGKEIEAAYIVETSRILDRRKTGRKRLNTNVKKRKIIEEYSLKRSRDSDGNRKRSHNESESLSDEETQEPKVVKKIKMKTRKFVRVKQKAHTINENSSDEDLIVLKKKEKSSKGLKPKAQESQKEVILKKKKDKAEDKSVKAQEVDPLDISDQSNVRQSRRIAQIKIKEEATRRQMEEVALRELKEQHKKKGGKKKPDIDWRASSPDHSSGSDTNRGQKKKGKLLKKEKMKEEKTWKTGWHSSSGKEHTATESDGPLEELEYHDDGGDDDYLKEKSDHEFSPESENDCPEVIPVRRARTLRKSYLERPEISNDDESEAEGACGACGGQGQPDWILLCDDCNAGRHAACLKPILFLIPEGHWYCPPCDEKRLIKSLEDKLVEYEDLLEAIKNEPVEPEEEKAEKPSDSEGSHDNSDDTDSSSEDSDDGKIYRLRERKQLPISYHFKEYDQLISSAIKEEYHEKTTSAGNQGRGKDISTIIEADKEEKEKAKMEAKQKDSENAEGDVENANEGSEDEEAKKRRERARKVAMRRRPRKLNSLEVLSEDDDDNSDEDFKETGSCSNSSSEESNAESDSDSGSHSSDSLPLRRSQRDSNQTKRRKRIVESPELKKKRHNVIDDDTSSESSGSKAWSSSKKPLPKMRFMPKKKSKKKKKKRKTQTASGEDVPKMPKSRVRYGGLNSDSDDSHDWSPAHRTRQLKINYTEIPNTDSEAEAHKPSGKHMDSTDEYKEGSDSTDSDSDKAAKFKKENDSSDTEKVTPEKGNNDVEKMMIELESQKKAVVPLEKLPDDIALKFSPTKEIPENSQDSAVLCATETPIRGRGGKGTRGSRGSRGSSGGRGRGAIRRGSLNTSTTDGEGNLDGLEMKSDDGSFTGDGIKTTKAKATLPPTPQQIERERKRQEREAKLAEREKKKQEKIKMKEEKSQLKEQKAKEREEKKQARLALLENKKQKKLQDMEANEVHENMNPMLHNPNIPAQFRNYRPQMPLHLRMPGPRMLRPQYPQHFFPRPGSERPMHPGNFSPPPESRNPVAHHGEHGPRPQGDMQQHYPINNFGPIQMAIAHRVRPPGMLGPRGELMNPVPIKNEPLDQMPSPHEGRQVAPLNYAMDPRSSNAFSDDANSPMHSDSEANPRSASQTKGSIRALTPAELMAPGRNMSHGPVGMMERMAHRSLPYMNPPMRDDVINPRMPNDSPQKRRGRGPGKKTLARQVSNGGTHPRPPGGPSSGMHSAPSTSNIPEGTLSVAGSPQPFKPATDPPSIITRMPHMMPPPYRGSSMYGGNRPIYGSPSRPPLHMGMYRPHGSHPHDPSPSGGGPVPMPNSDRINIRPQYPPYPQSPYYPPQMPYHARYPPPDLPHPHPHPLHPLHPQPHPAHSHPPPREEESQREDSSPRPEVSRSPLSLRPSPQLPTNTSPALSPHPSPHPSPHLSPGNRIIIKRSPESSPPPQQERPTTPPRPEDRTSKLVDGKAEKTRARVTSAARYPQGPYAPQFVAYGPYPPSTSHTEPDGCPDRSGDYEPQNIGPPVPTASIQPLIPPDSPPAKPETETASKVETNDEETSEFGGLVSYFSSQREDDIEE